MPNTVPAPDPLKKASNVPYVIAVVVMALIAVVAVLGIVMLRPEADNTILIATMLGFAGSTTASILALMKSQETHLTVNSQLAQWKQDFAGLMRAEGAEKAVKDEQDRVAVMEEKSVAAAALEAATTIRTVTSKPAPLEPMHVKIDDKEPVKVDQTSKKQ